MLLPQQHWTLTAFQSSCMLRATLPKADNKEHMQPECTSSSSP
jgi:hypothetical protein